MEHSLQAGSECAKLLEVDLHSFHLHIREDLQQRLFHCVVQIAQVQTGHLVPYLSSEQDDGCGFLASVR